MSPSQPAAVRRVSVRLHDHPHGLAERTARGLGVPLAQYVREAVLMRVAWESGVRLGVELGSVECVNAALAKLREATELRSGPRAAG